MKKILKRRIYRHLLFWACVVVFFAGIELAASIALHRDAVYQELYWVNFIFESFPIYLCFTYSLLYKVLPLFLGKKYLRSVLTFLGLLLLIIFLQKILSELDLYLIQPYILHISSPLAFSWASVLADISHFFDWVTLTYDFLLVGFVAAAYRLFNEWISAERKSGQLEQEKLLTEMQLIKAQIDPDFFLHILDDLYEETVRASELAPEMVLRLSGLLSYLLYESQAQEIVLEKEVEMIDHYIVLMQRHDPSIEISKQITGSMQDKYIAPMLLLPFMEYIFKKEEYDGQPWASIYLSVHGDLLKMTLVKGTSRAGEVSFNDISKRLDNLYHGRYELKLLPEEDTVVIKLVLMLDPLQKIQQTHSYETEVFTS